MGALPLLRWWGTSSLGGAAAAAQVVAADSGLSLHRAGRSPTLPGTVTTAQVMTVDPGISVLLGGPGAGRSLTYLGVGATAQATAVDPGIWALSGAWEHPPSPAGSEVSASTASLFPLPCLLRSQSKVGAKAECCHSLAGRENAWGSANMPAPCRLGPLQTLGTNQYRREAKGKLRASWHRPAPWHKQPGHHQQQQEADKLLHRRPAAQKGMGLW